VDSSLFAVTAPRHDAGWGEAVPRSRIARSVEDAIHRYFRALGDRDSDAWVACFDEHGVAFEPSGGLPAVGHAALRAQAQRFLGSFDELYLRLDELHASTDSAAARWTCRAVIDGKRVDFAGVDVFEIGPDRLIRVVWSYWTRGPALSGPALSGPSSAG
jgi:ketosteroid isomerase-like protein